MFTNIKGLLRTFPETGKIKIGEAGPVRESQGGKSFRLPTKLDHFKIVTRFRGQDGRFILDDEIHKIVGEKPRELDVILVYDDPALNSPHRLTCYEGTRLYCEGDGESARRLNKDGLYQPQPCTCPLLTAVDKAPENQNRPQNQWLRCKPYGVLRVQLPQKKSSIGVYGFRTTSSETLSNIISVQEAILIRTGGLLAGIPLKLCMYPTTDNTPGGSTTNWKVMLDLPDGGWEAVEKHAREIAKQRLVTLTDMKALVAGHRRALAAAPMDQDEIEEIVSELYPEQATAADGAVIEATGQVIEEPIQPPAVAPLPGPAPAPEPLPPPVGTPAPAPQSVLPLTPPATQTPPPTEEHPGEATVDFASTDDPAKQVDILKKLAARKGFNTARLTKTPEKMDNRERWAFLRTLTSRPDKA